MLDPLLFVLHHAELLYAEVLLCYVTLVCVPQNRGIESAAVHLLVVLICCTAESLLKCCCACTAVSHWFVCPRMGALQSVLVCLAFCFDKVDC